jgi:hypothetical protein
MEMRSGAQQGMTQRGKKECCTTSGAISAGDGKHPFWVLAKAKSDYSHAKFNAIQT